MATITKLYVNGRAHGIQAEANRTLLSVLRDDLQLTGAKYGCGEGQCGACTVLLDGVPKRSCQIDIGEAAEKKVTTMEGLEQDGKLHPLQEACLELGAMQCAYCISGMIISGVGLLAKNPSPSEADIVRFMEGNICRCGTYPRIIAAIKQAAAKMKGGAK